MGFDDKELSFCVIISITGLNKEFVGNSFSGFFRQVTAQTGNTDLNLAAPGESGNQFLKRTGNGSALGIV